MSKYNIGMSNMSVIHSFSGNDMRIYKREKNFSNYDNRNNFVAIKPALNLQSNELVPNAISTCNFENIKNRCNPDIVTQYTFKQLCYALEDDNPMHKQIKNYIIDLDKSMLISIDNLYKLTLNYIFNNKLTDVTIKFSDKETYECNKLVLNTNEYFKKMIDDCGNNTNEIFLITESDTTILLIKSLYHKSYNEIESTNFYKIFMLMDMMLMGEEHIIMMLNILENNMKSIIYYELKKNNYDNILKLTEQLNHFYKNSPYSNNTKSVAYHLYELIFGLDYGIKIFNFVGWSTLFNDQQKLNAITSIKNLELLNDSKISFHVGINFLKDFDFNNDIYTKIDNLASLEYTCIYFNYNNIKVNNDKFPHKYNVVILNEWYPIFSVCIFERMDAEIINIKSSSITIKIWDKGSIALHNDSKILFGDIINTNSENIFTVKQIKKCSNDKSAITNSTIFTNNDKISYKVKLNKKLPNDYEKLIWSEKNVQTNSTTLNYPIWRMKQISHTVEGVL